MIKRSSGQRLFDSIERRNLPARRAGDDDAHVTLTVFFTQREPVAYRVTVPARRTLHLRFNDLKDPEPIPLDTDYSSVFESDVPIIVQHTRLDSRRAEISLLSTMAYAED